MVDTALVKQDLTPEMIQAGAELLQSLDAAQVPVTSAFWLYRGDEADWRLIIASPDVEKKGIREFYLTLVDHLHAMTRDELKGSYVTAVTPDDKIVVAIRKIFKTSGIRSIRFTGNVINGILIPDALIYRST
jgi:hypothetical protein